MDTRLDAYESETGVSDLRLLNQSLCGLVNRVIAVSEETDFSTLEVVLADLREAVIAQFVCEELAMSDINYGATVPHHADHEQLLTEIQRQIVDLEEGKGDSSFLSQFIPRWFLHHVVSHDMAFMMSLSADNGTATLSESDGDNNDVEGSFDDRGFDIPEPIVWSQKYSVDIRPIDEDHKAIFSLLKDIVESRASSDQPSLAILLERLGDETSAHFRSEEKVMAEHNYEFAAQHAEQHRKLLDEYAYQIDEYRNNSISAELMCRFVYQWFIRHIELSDIPLSNAIHRELSLS